MGLAAAVRQPILLHDAASSLNPQEFLKWARANLAPLGQAAVGQAPLGQATRGKRVSLGKLAAWAYIFPVMVVCIAGGKSIAASIFLSPFSGLMMVVVVLAPFFFCTWYLCKHRNEDAQRVRNLAVDCRNLIADKYGFTPVEPHTLLDIEGWRTGGLVPQFGFGEFRNGFIGKWHGREVLIAETAYFGNDPPLMLAIIKGVKTQTHQAVIWHSTHWSISNIPAKHASPSASGGITQLANDVELPPGLFASGYKALSNSNHYVGLNPRLAKWLLQIADRTPAPARISLEPTKALVALPYSVDLDQMGQQISGDDIVNISFKYFARLSTILTLVEALDACGQSSISALKPH